MNFLHSLMFKSWSVLHFEWIFYSCKILYSHVLVVWKILAHCWVCGTMQFSSSVTALICAVCHQFWPPLLLFQRFICQCSEKGKGYLYVIIKIVIPWKGLRDPLENHCFRGSFLAFLLPPNHYFQPPPSSINTSIDESGLLLA